MRKPKDITELHIGMKFLGRDGKTKMNIVGVFAAGYPNLDNDEDIIYADFEDNPGDAFEFTVNEINLIDD